VNQCAAFMATLELPLKEQVGDINETTRRSDQHLYKWI
jgi:hypothetical protein